MEPHHELPLLSWLPSGLADAYLRASGRGEHYDERYRTRPGLRRMVARAGLRAWDYTVPVLLAPEAFDAEADLPARGASGRLLRAVTAPGRLPAGAKPGSSAPPCRWSPPTGGSRRRGPGARPAPPCPPSPDRSPEPVGPARARLREHPWPSGRADPAGPPSGAAGRLGT